jgi:hypothetical protein
MSRMTDRMLTGTIDVPHWVRADVTREQIAQQRDTMAEAMTSVPVIVIDNVCEYLYAGTSQEEWLITRDFPTLAPPFPRFWMEMRRPSKIVSEVHGERRVTDYKMGHAWGFMVHAFNPHERVDDAVQAMVKHAHDGHLEMTMDSTLRTMGPAIQRKRAESGGDVEAFRRLLGPHEVEVLQGMKFYQAFARSGYDPAMAEAAIRASLTANRDIRWTISFDHLWADRQSHSPVERGRGADRHRLVLAVPDGQHPSGVAVFDRHLVHNQATFFGMTRCASGIQP